MDKNTAVKSQIYLDLKVTFQNVEQQIKKKNEYKQELQLKVDLYNKCLDDHLLEKGSKVIREHLDATKKEIRALDDEVEQLVLEKDAYRIELEVFEHSFKD